MIKPSEILSSNLNVCDINNATLISNAWRALGIWDNVKTWEQRRAPTPDDIVYIRAENTVQLPKDKSQIQVAGLCIKGTLITPKNKLGASPYHAVVTASVIHNMGTISTTEGQTGEVNITSSNYEHPTAAGSVSLFASRFINEGNIVAERGGDDIPKVFFDKLDTAATNAWGGDGGHIGIFPHIFINEGGNLTAGRGGDAILFENWATYIYGNAYAGRGGSINISAQNIGGVTIGDINAPQDNGLYSSDLSRSTGNLTSGRGGDAESIGSWLQKTEIDGWFRETEQVDTGKFFDVVGGTGGDLSININHMGGKVKGSAGDTRSHVKVFPTEYLRYEPTLLKVDETTRLTNANHIFIYAGDDAYVDLRKLVPNAVNAYKSITVSVGANSVVDLSGVSDKVFQAPKFTINADEVVLDDGVTLENLVEADEISVNASKVLYFVDLAYQSQAKGTAGSILPVNLTLLNNGPTKDTYTVEAHDSQGWLLQPYPTEVSVNGLRRSELSINVKLPDTGREYTELLVIVTSQSDPSVQQTALVRVSIAHPESITPRDGRLADVSIVLDAHYRIEKRLDDLADIIEKWLGTKRLAPSDEKVKAWLGQFDETNPPSKEAYVEFIEQFQPQNPPPLPVIELITFTDTAMTRVVTDNLGDVIGRMRALQTSDDDTCDLASVDAIEYAVTNLKEGGHLFLATASTPTKDMSTAIEQLNAKRIQAHVLLVENCDGSEATAAAYRKLSGETGGIFRLTTDDKASDMAALEELLDSILSMGKYTVMGTIKNEAGEPLAGVVIEINKQTTTTDAAGNWEIPNFMEGKYTLTASKEGYVFSPQLVEVGNELYDYEVEIKPLSSLVLSVVPNTWDDLRQGEELTLTMTVVNGGANKATGVTLTNVIPEGTTVVDFDALYGGSCDIDTLTCQLPDLNPGISAVVELTLRNDQAQTLRNVATLTANEYPADIQNTFKRVKPHLSVTLSDKPDPVVMNGALHYEASVELSPIAPDPTASEVKLFMHLPEGTKLTAINTEYGTCDISDYPDVNCQFGDLSTASLNGISRVIVDVDLELTDANLLLLTNEARVVSTNYPAHVDKETTKIVVPPEAVADVTFVMDTTHSMYNEVNGVIKALKLFVEEQMAANKNPLVSIIEFKDNVTLKAFTTDLPHVIDTIQAFKVEAGGTCEEASAEALDLAITHTRQGGTIMLLTDAAPYGDADLTALAQRIRNKQIKFNVLISGDCATSSGENNWK